MLCQVWFRRGVNSHNPCGSGWIGMVGEMIMITVGLNDQVRAEFVCWHQITARGHVEVSLLLLCTGLCYQL